MYNNCNKTLDPYLKQYLLGETRQDETRQSKARQGRATLVNKTERHTLDVGFGNKVLTVMYQVPPLPSLLPS